jgi:hypothetical protein
MTTRWCVLQNSARWARACHREPPHAKAAPPTGAPTQPPPPPSTAPTNRPPPPQPPSSSPRTPQNSHCGVCGHHRKPPPPPPPAYREGVNPLRPANSFFTKAYDLIRRADSPPGEDSVLQGLWNYERTMRMRMREELQPSKPPTAQQYAEAAAAGKPLPQPCAMAPLPAGWPDMSQEYDAFDNHATTRHLLGRGAFGACAAVLSGPSSPPPPPPPPLVHPPYLTPPLPTPLIPPPRPQWAMRPCPASAGAWQPSRATRWR